MNYNINRIPPPHNCSGIWHSYDVTGCNITLTGMAAGTEVEVEKYLAVTIKNKLESVYAVTGRRVFGLNIQEDMETVSNVEYYIPLRAVYIPDAEVAMTRHTCLD